MANLFDQIPKDGYPKAPTADGSQNNPLNTEVGRNLSNLASAIPGAAGVPGAVAMGTGLAARALGASAPAVGVVGRAAQAAAPYAPVAAGAVALNSATSTTTPATTLASAVPGAPPQAAPAAPNPTDQRLAMGTQTAQPTAPALPTTSAPAPSAQPVGNEIAPGVYRNAPGQYSDNAQGMNMPAGFTGRPNPQNMAAAANLAAAPQAPAGRSLAEAALSQPSGVQAPVVRNSTNDWAARNNLRNLAVSASSITANGGRFDQSGRGDSPEVAAYKAALANDFALQQAQPGLAAVAMRENAGIQREGMQQEGATTRTGIQEQGSNARAAVSSALQRDEFGLKKEAAGFQTRAAARLENLQTRYEAEKDPAKRSELAQQLRELQAKDAAHRMEVVRGKTDPMTGQSSGDYVVVQDPKTGEVRQIQMGAASAPQAMPKPASKAEFDALPKGARFTDPNGQVRIK